MEKNKDSDNEKPTDALSRDTSSGYVEDDEIIKTDIKKQSFDKNEKREDPKQNKYALELRGNLKTQYQAALERFGLTEPVQSIASEDNQEDETRLKTAFELAMKRADSLIAEEKEDKIEKTPDFIEGEELRAVENKLDQEPSKFYLITPKAPELEGDPSVKLDLNRSNSENNTENKSEFTLKTFYKWKTVFNREMGLRSISKLDSELKRKTDDHNSILDEIEKNKAEIISTKESYNSKIDKVEDKNIKKTLIKNRDEKITQIEQNIVELENEKNIIDQEVSDTLRQINEAEDKINDIESKYSGLIDSKIAEIKDRLNYDGLLEQNQFLDEKILKFSGAYEKIKNLIKEVSNILDGDDRNMFSKEDINDLKKRLKNLKKRSIIYSAILNRLSEDKNKNIQKINKIDKKIKKFNNLKH